MKRIYLVLLALFMAGCGYDKFTGEPSLEPGDHRVNYSIAGMLARHEGNPIVVNDQLVVLGYVTTSDASGNFYRTFIIENEGAAMEIKAGLYYLHRVYPVGLSVSISLKDLIITKDRGVLQVGVMPYESAWYESDYFNHRSYLDQYVARNMEYKIIEPRVATISGLAEAMCGTLLRFDNLCYDSDDPATWAGDDNPYASYAYRIFKDPEGNEIAVYTSDYADFCSDTIPSGTVSISGILQYGKVGTTEDSEMFIIKPRSINDVSE